MSAAPLPAAVPRDGLGARVMRAGSWALAGQAGAQAMRLATNVVLARLLSPDAFGLMSVVYMLTIALALFSDLGINRSVVQSPRGHDPDLLDTAWTMQVMRGGGLALATFVVALGFVLANALHLVRPGTVYADPKLPWLIAAFAVSAQISGFESIRIGQARRNVQLQRLTKIELGSQAAAAVLMLGIAWLTRSIWALVFGAVFSNALRVGLSHLVLHGHRERFRLEPTAVRELMSNAKWIFMSSILGFLAANGDRVMLAGLIDSHAFGLYAVAFLLCSVLLTVSSTLSISVAYPAFSEVARERPLDLPRTIAKFLQAYDLVLVSLAGIVIVASPALVHLLYDERYQQAGWMLSILAAGSIGMRSQVVEQCYQAVGQPQYITLANFIRLVFLIGGIWIGYHSWGLMGVLVAIAISQFAPWPLAIWFLARRKALTWRANAVFVPALAGGMLVGWVVSLGIGWLLPGGHAALKHMI